jgi:glutaconate CoA-transferase subunit A
MTVTLETAVEDVDDGESVYLSGFGFSQSFAAAHEIIRQGLSDLRIVRASGDIMLDQLVGAGCVREAVVSHCWNAIGPTPTHAFRRAVEDDDPQPLTVEEYSLGNVLLRLFAGARRLPFIPAGPVEGTAQFESATGADDRFTPVTVDGETHYVMPPLRPDVGFVHVERADERGNAQLTGAKAEIKHGAMACDRVVVLAEEIVSEATIRDSPDDTIVPGFMVDQVVHTPGGSHPSGVPDRYGRDVPFLEYYGEQTETKAGFEAFLDEWVYGVDDRAEYVEQARAAGYEEVPR